MDDVDRDILGNIKELSDNMRDMCLALALAHEAKPSHMLAAMTMTITLLTLDHSKPGQEVGAIESLIDGIRSLVEDIEDMDRRAAEKEAREARASGSIQ